MGRREGHVRVAQRGVVARPARHSCRQRATVYLWTRQRADARLAHLPRAVSATRLLLTHSITHSQVDQLTVSIVPSYPSQPHSAVKVTETLLLFGISPYSLSRLVHLFP